MIFRPLSKVEYSTHPVDIISSTFKMGSMTGAPKLSAMKIIEELRKQNVAYTLVNRHYFSHLQMILILT